MEELINRLRQYSQSLVAYKLGADFSDAVCKAADTLESHTYERSAMIAEIENLQEELSQVKAERDALIHEAGEDKCALALMAYQYFNDMEGILWNECMSAGEAACRQLGLPNCFDKNMLWSMIEDYENTGKWRGPKKEA